ncbi:PepSY domain-containing protein [Comamonas aquatica]|uniref:PepSY domain-containing protein n=1 Tax=Comamonas aquatica TaxID=225991 RepID=UPI003B97EC58
MGCGHRHLRPPGDCAGLHGTATQGPDRRLFRLDLPARPGPAACDPHRPVQRPAPGRHELPGLWPLGRWLEWGINVHLGQEFGVLNQVVLVVACLAIILLCVSAGTMWWKRRPAKGWGVPPQPQDARSLWGVTALLAVGGVLFPWSVLRSWSSRCWTAGCAAPRNRPPRHPPPRRWLPLGGAGTGSLDLQACASTPDAGHSARPGYCRDL